MVTADNYPDTTVRVHSTDNPEHCNQNQVLLRAAQTLLSEISPQKTNRRGTNTN